MLGKTQVYEFLDKLQAKAIVAVNNDFDAQLETAIENYFNDPANVELKQAIVDYNSSSQIVKEAAGTILRLTGKGVNIAGSDVAYRLFKAGSPISVEPVNIIQADRKIMVDRINKEYGKIRDIVKSKRNGQAAKEALIALGFDVEYLNKQESLPVVINPKEITVDKSLLFPCKEYGIKA